MRVLASFGELRPTTNPYLKQLAHEVAAQPGVELLLFSWRTAFLGRYDVFHVHWPEIMLEGRTPLRRAVRRLQAALFALRLLVTRTPVVRTWHNLERPSGLARVDHVVLDLFDRATVLRIRLNDSSPMPPDAPHVTIAHGHYRQWFRDYPRTPLVTGRIAFVGRIRRYKGVETLIEAFGAVDDPELSLHVAGLASTDELVEVLSGLAAPDPRVTLRFEYLDDAAFVEAVTAAELVVLPYRHMHNSGSVLAALSLDRPVLVPDNEVNRRLSAEVGPGWIHLYSDEVTGDDLVEVFQSLRRSPLDGSPDLDGRAWDLAGPAHARAYRQALAGTKRH
jgi:glycosyltransferase involved in cell wall biosynthesis